MMSYTFTNIVAHNSALLKLHPAAYFTDRCSALSASSALRQGKTILPLISSALFGSLFFFSALFSVSRRLGGERSLQIFPHSLSAEQMRYELTRIGRNRRFRL